ncbi:MAG: hypothetical protein H7647_08765, partial [Candidatus Heimdallarchaeota archaeon]|nr:hypothetical protein [Candidatus Heimdallarchaeota archaeon]MCK4254518.1 hypothetical protein [Candidatus Heimdallarchaeota archaeon]
MSTHNQAYGKLEEEIICRLSKDTEFIYQGESYKTIICTKPRTQGRGGEPKTDVFIRAINLSSENIKDFRISVKMDLENVFVENKITKDRFNEIFSSQTQSLIKKSFTNKIIKSTEIVIDKSEKKFLLGWKCEILVNDTRLKRIRIPTTPEEALEIYSGQKRPERFRDAIILGEIVKNSGIAEFILSLKEEDLDDDAFMTKLVPIRDYVKKADNRIFDIVLTA